MIASIFLYNQNKRSIQAGFFLCLVVILSFAAPVYSQSTISLSPLKSLSQYNLSNWITEDGLPSNAVLCSMQSKNGYLWFGTSDGLVRFDGKDFHIYRLQDHPETGINFIAAIVEDREGVIWIGTSAGLLKLAHDIVEVVAAEKMPSFITSLALSHDGGIWIGSKSGLAQYKEAVVTIFYEPQLVYPYQVNDLLLDAHHELWLATEGAGLMKVSAGKFTQFTKEDGLLSDTINTLYEDVKSAIWVGTDKGVNRIGGINITDLTIELGLPSNNIYAIDGDNSGTIYIGTSEGLSRVLNSNISTLPTSSGPDIVTNIMHDHEGSLWLGTAREGLYRLTDGKFFHYGVSEGLPHPVVNVVYVDGKKIWLGTDQGLALIEGGVVSSFSISKTNKSNQVTDILRDSKGQLWLATFDGLILYNDGVKKQYGESDGLLSNRVTSIAEDEYGILYIGTTRGLNTLDDGKMLAFDQSDGLSNDYILSVFVDKQKNKWIGTNGGGLNLLKDGKFTTYSTNDGLSGNWVFRIYEDKSGILWIGTNNGLTRFDGRQFFSYASVGGMVDDAIFQVLEDNNANLWLSGSKGLFSIKKSVLNGVIKTKAKISENQIHSYAQSDGLRSNELSESNTAAISADGKLWIPTRKGVSVIDPDNIPINRIPPPVVIQDVIVDEKVYYQQQGQITIPPGAKFYQIKFAGLSYQNPQLVKYKYKLEGYDQQWIDAGQTNVANYRDLPAGNYTFHVKATNSDGIWNEEGAKVELKQEAYFYQTLWFYLLVLMALAGLGYLIYLLRMEKLKKRNIELQQIVEQRTLGIKGQNESIQKQKEELKQLNAIKDKLFSVISHDLRGPLFSIDQILNLISTGNMTHEELKFLSKDLHNQVKPLLRLLDNLLHWAKAQMQGINVQPSIIDVDAIIEENFRLFGAEAKKKNITLENDINIRKKAFADPDMVNFVIRNLVANAIKFTPEGGKININAQANGEFLEVCVADTGRGIAPEKISGVFDIKNQHNMIGDSKEVGTGLGLILSRDFVEQNGGRIWVESEPGKGSQFKFELKNIMGDN